MKSIVSACKTSWLLVVFCLLFVIVDGCGGNSSKRTRSNRVGYTQTGKASWYGPGFNGNRTANNEIFNQNAMTAAHPNLPFHSKVKVTNLKNNKTVVVRINDRGPFKHGRIIDLSKGAASKIGMIRDGVVPVRIEVIR
jgi:rare lipoprotein A